MSEQIEKLVEWISSQNGISVVVPISIRIEGHQWVGVRYLYTEKWEAGQDGVTRGDHKVGEEWTEERFYFLGDRPNSYKTKKGGVCFIGPNKETFYVSCYIGDKELKKCNTEQLKYHPFGPSFMLGIWPDKFGEIDKYEQKKYRRIPLSMSTNPSVD